MANGATKKKLFFRDLISFHSLKRCGSTYLIFIRYYCNLPARFLSSFSWLWLWFLSSGWFDESVIAIDAGAPETACVSISFLIGLFASILKSTDNRTQVNEGKNQNEKERERDEMYVEDKQISGKWESEKLL